MPNVTRYIIAKLPTERVEVRTGAVSSDGHEATYTRRRRARFYRGVDGVIWQGWRFKAWQFLTAADAYDVLGLLEGDGLEVQPLRFWSDEG